MATRSEIDFWSCELPKREGDLMPLVKPISRKSISAGYRIGALHPVVLRNGGATVFAILAFLLSAVSITPRHCQAWGAHELISFYALCDLPELKTFKGIQMKPYSYGDLDKGPYNPKFEIKYILGEGRRTVSAFEILINYAPEPDWDLDTDLSLSPLQGLTGGSQGWRHQRYTFLGGLISLGVAPERVKHFYDLAITAHKKGDSYWAFRFLARSLHYLQDLGQPLHSLPMPTRDALFRYRLNQRWATTAGKNVHHNLEAYIAYYLRAGLPEFTAALRGKEAPIFSDVEKDAVLLNNLARRYAERQYNLALTLWPQLLENRNVDLTPGDFRSAKPKETVTELREIVQATLRNTGYYSRGLVRHFLKEISGDGRGT